MRYFKTIAAALTVSFALSSCDPSEFGDINETPNYPSTAYTSMLFQFSAKYVRNFVMNSSSYDPWTQEYAGYISESKNNQFGPLTTTTQFGTSTYYTYVIKNLNQIIEMNEDEAQKNGVNVLSFGDNDSQIGVAKTLRAFFYMTLTDILGPIAYSEAFKGESEENWLPAYDSQESIYKALDEDLVSAFAQMKGNLTNSDFLYGGDIAKWKKFNATLRMMMAIKMADVDPTNGKARFQKAYADGGMTEVGDGFNYTFDSTAFSTIYYVGNESYTSAGLNFVPNKVLVSNMKEYKDPRLFTYTTIGRDEAGNKVESGALYAYKGVRKGSRYDFDAYYGVPFGLESNAMVSEQSSQCASVATKYAESTATYGVITTARCLLVEAEAALRGWISADAETLYNAGIKASFDYEKSTDKTGWSYDLDAYMAQDKVKFSSNADTAMKQIVMQRFFAGFMTDGVEAWADWRRFNIPDLPMYEGQLSGGYKTYPYRMCYSDTDTQYNADQVNDAVSKYLGGKDDRYARLWWDVKDNTSSEGTLDVFETWDNVGVGTMVHNDIWFADEGETLSVDYTVQQMEEDETWFRIVDFGAAPYQATIKFQVKADGTITVPEQSLRVRETYGSFDVCDYATFKANMSGEAYFDADEYAEYMEGVNCFKKDNVFTFYLVYFYAEYYPPYYHYFNEASPEVMTLNESATQAVKMAAKKAADWKSVPVMLRRK